jgi:hypothetical protein
MMEKGDIYPETVKWKYGKGDILTKEFISKAT